MKDSRMNKISILSAKEARRISDSKDHSDELQKAMIAILKAAKAGKFRAEVRGLWLEAEQTYEALLTEPQKHVLLKLRELGYNAKVRPEPYGGSYLEVRWNHVE